MRDVTWPHDPEHPDHDAADRIRAQQAAHSAWQCLLHDQVAVAFRAAATPGVARLEVRRSADAALAAIDELAGTGDDPDETSPADGTTDLVPALREVGLNTRPDVDIHSPGELVIPSVGATAIVGAVAESLRNVERHAAGAGVRVLVRHDGQTVTVAVVDDGPGFVVGTTTPPGGLRVSVADRMARAGGTAHLASAPGQGTTVTLTWPHPAPPAPAHRDRQRSWRRQVHTRHQARLDEIVVPFLRRLAQADAPLDHATRTAAALAEQCVRDEMHLPGVLDAPTREAVRAARADGSRVRVQCDDAAHLPEQVASQVNAIMTATLSVRPAPREVTVSLYTDPATTNQGTTVAVVALPGSPERREALRAACGGHLRALTDDDDATWAEVHIPA
ncbi:MAG: hypothetical protein FWE61_03715 [Micrococcales bacterium]|nr:hypothetical protein [Micrococcales bacterium]